MINEKIADRILKNISTHLKVRSNISAALYPPVELLGFTYDRYDTRFTENL